MTGTVVVDVDGTLVDSSYHHVMAWHRAFMDVGVHVPVWQLHHFMGMGGDQIPTEAAGERVERALGKELRDRWREHYDDLLSEVHPFPEATASLAAFRDAGATVVLATSGNEGHVARTLEILELGTEEYPLVSAADVENTKPAKDIIELALERGSGGGAVVVGDTVWDVEAARRADVPAVAVLSGGISASRLRAAGAVRVYDDIRAVAQARAEVLALL